MRTFGDTWLEDEDVAYPSGGFLRRACVRLRKNPYAPDALPSHLYDTLRIVKASIPDTYFTIPARMRMSNGKTISGFVSIDTDARGGSGEFTFTPSAKKADPKS